MINKTKSFLPLEHLKAQAGLPDVLTMLDGTAVTTPRQWRESRAPELKALFQHYVYGPIVVAPPLDMAWTLVSTDTNFLDGKVTRKELRLSLKRDKEFTLKLTLLVPNNRQGAAPVFVVPHPATIDNPETKPLEIRPLRLIAERGYALATFNVMEVADDVATAAPVRIPVGESEWVQTSTLAAWAWCAFRVIDYLVTDADINPRQIAMTGHSRRGKTSLLAAAFDERIAIVIPNQAGTGGPAPSRKTNPNAETVGQINAKFPHWFNAEYKKFAGHEDRLPFDQHGLIALVAPRPVLLTVGQQDQWADPAGQFDMLKEANAVYRLLGSEGLGCAAIPPMGKLVDSPLGYLIRDCKHCVDEEFWKGYLDFADKHFRRG